MASSMSQRPPFIISSADVPEDIGRYPGSDEIFSRGRPIGKAAGLLRIGLHLERLPPGHRLSFYPLNPERRGQMPWSEWWHDIPLAPQGPHAGKPRGG